MIDTQAIRSKILDLAMRGKLTEQLPEDGMAEELYRQIQAEKQKLIKSGKIKKEKPLPEISADEIPFAIPDNWKWVRLGNIGITTTGGTPSKTHPEYYGGNYPFFKPSDLDAGRHIAKASEYLTEAGKVVSRQFQQNSILVCCIGSIGKAAIIDTEGTANQQINAFTPLDSESDYLLYAISSDAFQHQLDHGSRATTVSIINKSKFDNCILPLPPLAEQHRIVARIDQAFSALDTIDALQAKYAENLAVLKSKLIDAAIQGKLTEQLPEDGTAEELYRQIQAEKQALIKAGKIKKEKPLPEITADEIPFEIPANWKWVRLGAILSVQPSNGFSPQSVAYQTPYKNLTLTATTSGFFKPEAFKYVSIPPDVAEKYYLDNDDILIQRSNSRDLVGTSCIYRHGSRKYIYPDLMMRIHVMVGINTDFIDYVLKAPLSRAFFIQEASGTSDSMPKINQATVRNTLIPLPPLAEQKRIVERISELLAVCDELKIASKRMEL